MTYRQKITKIMTSGKTTGEILKQLELLRELRELRKEIKTTCENFCKKFDYINNKFDKQLEDK